MAIKRNKRFVADYKCENCGEIMLRIEEEGVGLKAPEDPESSKFFHIGTESYYECPYCEARHKLYRIKDKLDIGPIYNRA